MNTCTHIELDPAVENEIISFILECTNDEDEKQRRYSGIVTGRPPHKINTLYSVLRKLGFGYGCIEYCLSNPAITTQPHAVDYMCLRGHPKELPDGWSRAKVLTSTSTQLLEKHLNEIRSKDQSPDLESFQQQQQQQEEEEEEEEEKEPSPVIEPLPAPVPEKQVSLSSKHEEPPDTWEDDSDDDKDDVVEKITENPLPEKPTTSEEKAKHIDPVPSATASVTTDTTLIDVKDKKKGKKEKKDKKEKKQKKDKKGSASSDEGDEKGTRKEKKDKKDKADKKAKKEKKDREKGKRILEQMEKAKEEAAEKAEKEAIAAAAAAEADEGDEEDCQKTAEKPTPKEKKKKGKQKGPNPLKQLHLQKKVVDSMKKAEEDKKGPSDSKPVKGMLTPQQEETRRVELDSRWNGKTPSDHLKEHCKKISNAVIYEKLASNSGDPPATLRMRLALVPEGTKALQISSREEYSPDKFFFSEQHGRDYTATMALYSQLSSKNIPLFRSLPPSYREMWLSWAADAKQVELQCREEGDSRKASFVAKLAEIDKKMTSANKSSSKKVPSASTTKRIAYRLEDDFDGEDSDSDGDSSPPTPKELSPADQKEKDDWNSRVATSLEMKKYQDCLPVSGIKNRLLSTLRKTPCVVVAGETGCGKTTQIPRYILEEAVQGAGASTVNIICCQPRRIAAVSVAQRVADEMGIKMDSLVGYHFRGTRVVSPNCRLTFCTTGILLRYLLSNPSLDDYTHVIIDEVHERTLQTDFLLEILRSLLFTRKGLRVIIMSATIDTSTYTSYFGGAPLFTVRGTTSNEKEEKQKENRFPVTLSWLEDVIEMTGYSVTANHYKVSHSSLTREEVASRKRLADTLRYRRMRKGTVDTMDIIDESVINPELIAAVLRLITRDYGAGAVLVFLPGIQEINSVYQHLTNCESFKRGYQIMPLHSLLGLQDQKAVFARPPCGVRKVILATNIAEASVTIPDVTFVIDSGRVKEVRYEHSSKVQCLVNTHVSKSSAVQRRGRAGRVQEGFCFCLYSSETFEHMRDYQLPEMLRLPLQDICLQICNLIELNRSSSSGVSGVSEFLKKSLSPPNQERVAAALELLLESGAITEDENVTPLGAQLSNLPVDIRLGKTLLLGAVLGVREISSIIVAAESVKSPFLLNCGERQLDFAEGQCDHLGLYHVFNKWREARKQGNEFSFCHENGVSERTLRSIQDEADDLNKHLEKESLVVDVPALSHKIKTSRILPAVLCGGMYPNILKGEKIAKASCYRWLSREGEVVLNRVSINQHVTHFNSPYLVFTEKAKTGKATVRETSSFHYIAILLFADRVLINHSDHSVIVGGWMRFTGTPRTLSAINGLRQLLQTHIDSVMTRTECSVSPQKLIQLLSKVLAL